MANPTGLGPVAMKQDVSSSQLTFDKGTFGHYTVVIGESQGAKAEEATKRELGLVCPGKEVSFWERIVDLFTGSLSREKNQALIGFISTGDAKSRSLADETLGGATRGTVQERVSAFKHILSGKSNATPEEKEAACEAFKAVIKDAWEPEDKEAKAHIEKALDELGKNTKNSTEVGLKLVVLQGYLSSGIPSDEDFDLFVGQDDEGLFVGDEHQWGMGPFSLDDGKPGVDPFGPGSVEVQGKKGDITVVDSKSVPTPLADALGALADKIQTSDGGVHPKILEMQELLEKGTQPVVLLEKLEKFYDSPSVKYNEDNKQAVREAAKDIYDKTIHGQSMASYAQTRVVDALVGMDFKNIDTMRLS